MPIRPAAEPAVFTPPAGQTSFDEATLDAMELCYHENGFVVLRGVFAPELMDRMEAECVRAQQQVIDHEVDERYGSTVFLDDAAKAEKFANYVEFVNELSPAVVDAATHPNLLTALRRLLGEDCWMRDASQFGIVYQDARPGKESGYTRIGWHSDWQAGPSLTIWPSTAFTFHIDGTSPANGFLRVVPGSHRWATPAPYRNVNNVEVPDTAAVAGGYTDTPPPFEMPLRFESIPGEIPVYTERGDVILHDAYLWHSAARATAEDTTRRHVRGGYFAGDRATERVEQFIKNAAR
jgi:ectoine hydroxylase-related dioxygenase (phytanoyl-CoA dioxygenase family)